MASLIQLYGLDHQALISWLFKEYGLAKDADFQNPHRIRRQQIADRLDLYRDQGERALGAVIDKIYETQAMKETLRNYIPVALEQNVSRRIVNEIASLYDRPALRKLKERDEEFHVEEKRIKLHFVHQEAHRLTNLCNETLIWAFKGVDGARTLRIVTPNDFDAIPDPRDSLMAAGYILDAAPAGAWTKSIRDQRPNYEIWDDTFRYLVNAHGQIVDETGKPGKPAEHKLGRIPGALLHRRLPTTCILDDSYGEDIKSGHLGIALLEVMIMRLSKVQGENQPVLQGNLAAVATGQVMNGERPLALPPDVVASILNMKTDPDHYIAAQKEKLANLERTYGMGYDSGSGGEAGAAYEIRREKLTELRLEQRQRAVEHEAEVVELIGFSPVGMRVDFQEQATPTDASDEISLLDEKMRKGLDSPVAYLQRKDPDLTREDAVDLIKANLADYAALIQWVRALNVPDGADAANPGRTAQENGAMGGRPPADEQPKADVVKTDATATGE